MEFSRPEYWSGQPFPSPRDLPNPGIESRSPTLQEDSLPAEPQGKPKNTEVGSLSLLQGIFPTQGSNPEIGRASCRERVCLEFRRPGFDPWVGKIPWRRKRLPTPVFWPGEFHGLDRKESDRTEQLSLTLSAVHMLNSVMF